MENQIFFVISLKNNMKCRFSSVGSENGQFLRKVDSTYHKTLRFVKKINFAFLRELSFGLPNCDDAHAFVLFKVLTALQ